MFVSRGLSCHCVLFSVCVYPPCVKIVLAARCIYCMFIVLSSSISQVLSGMCIYVNPYVTADFCPSFRGLAGIVIEISTAAWCPLPHLEAEQVLFLETAAFCPLPTERLSSSPEYWIRNKPLYLNPYSVSELFGPNPHMLTKTEARSVTDTLSSFIIFVCNM